MLYGCAAIGVLLTGSLSRRDPLLPMVQADAAVLCGRTDRACSGQVQPRVRDRDLNVIPILFDDIRHGRDDLGSIVGELSLLGPLALPSLLDGLEDSNETIRVVATRTILCLRPQLKQQ